MKVQELPFMQTLDALQKAGLFAYQAKMAGAGPGLLAPGRLPLQARR